jgi:hypothetical protein
MQLSIDRPSRRRSSRVGKAWRLGAALLVALLLMVIAQPATAYEPGDGTTQFTVSISGPAPLTEYDTATYTAVPSYGAAPYTYTWFRNGWQVGTGATYTVNIVRSSFTLQVNATDALGATASASLSVYVTPECRRC